MKTFGAMMSLILLGGCYVPKSNTERVADLEERVQRLEQLTLVARPTPGSYELVAPELIEPHHYYASEGTCETAKLALLADADRRHNEARSVRGFAVSTPIACIPA